MKKFMYILIGIVVGFFSFPLAADLSQLNQGWVPFLVVPGYGTTEAFSGKCTKDISQNGHGWVFINREFFGCGKVNIFISDLIYGEYTKKPSAEAIKKLNDFKNQHGDVRVK